MLLAVNIGNTHTSFCVIKDNNIGKIYKIITNKDETVYGYAMSLKCILAIDNIDVKKIKGAIISSVVPPVTPIFNEAVKVLSGISPLIVGPGVKTGLHIKIDDPGTIASDLVASAVAAKECCPLPCAIVDMGTALTVTVIDSEGKYIGGVIAPGIKTSLDALTEKTSLLPHIEINEPKKAIPTNTTDSMKAGIIYGFSGAIDNILEKIEESLGTIRTVISTSGAENIIFPHCKKEIISDEKLLFKGLNIIWNKNTEV